METIADFDAQLIADNLDYLVNYFKRRGFPPEAVGAYLAIATACPRLTIDYCQKVVEFQDKGGQTDV